MNHLTPTIQRVADEFLDISLWNTATTPPHIIRRRMENVRRMAQRYREATGRRVWARATGEGKTTQLVWESIRASIVDESSAMGFQPPRFAGDTTQGGEVK